MDLVTKTIRDCTGLTLVEFCETYLETDSRSFSARLRKNRLYPNEAALICLLSDKKPIEVFERSTLETFFVKGKSEKVTAQVKEIIEKDKDLSVLIPSFWEKPVRPKKKVKFRSRKGSSITKKIIAKAPAKKNRTDKELEDESDFKIDVTLFKS